MTASSSNLGKHLLFAGLASLLIGMSIPATAATFAVNSTADAPDADPGDGVCADSDGRCTLRAAIMQANAAGGVNTIDLSLISDPNSPIVLSIPGTDEQATANSGGGYTITSAHDSSKGDLNITSSMNVVGAGPDKTIIEWDPGAKQNPGAGDRVFHIEAVSSNVDVTISGLAIENGVTPPPQVLATLPDGTYYQFERWGGGIAIGAAAAVTLINPANSGSDSGKGGSGGGGSEGGGGSGGSDEGESSAVINSVTLTNVRILNNQSGAAGGGISSAATLTLDNVLVSGNTAVTNGGGIYNDAALTVMNSTIGTMTGFATPNSAEGGGGLFDTGMHTTNIEQSAIVGNKGVGGGGISARSLVTMNIVNTTIEGNQASDVGAGITTNGAVTLQNDTIADNQAANDSTSGGAGLNAFGSGTYDFVNTLFQNNLATGSGTSASCGCSGSSCKAQVMVSTGHNLSDDSTCNLQGAGDLSNIVAQIQALAANGGPTETMALSMNTPAVDTGDNDHCPNTDQRGNMRPADGNLSGGLRCDIGAFELFTDSNDLHASGNRVQSTVRRGQAMDVGFDFTNDANATADATGVTIVTAPLPRGYSLSGATVKTAAGTADCAFNANDQVVSCDVGVLARGQTASLDLQGMGTQVGKLSFTASISATAPVDPLPDNNVMTVSTTVQGTSNISVTATGPTQQPQVHGQAGVSFTVKNLGPDAASNVKLLARFQNRMAFQKMEVSNGGTCTVGDDNSYATCNVGSLAAGDTVTGTLTLEPTSEGDTSVELQATMEEYDEDTTDNSTVVPVTILAQTTPTTPATGGSSGGGGCVSAPGGPFDPAMLVLLAVAVTGLGMRRRRRAK